MSSILTRGADLIIPVAEQHAMPCHMPAHTVKQHTRTRGNKLNTTVPHSEGSIPQRRKSLFTVENLARVLRGFALC